MSKIDKVVLRETAYISAWVLVFSSLLQAVFLIIGKWDMTVLLGNVYSDAAVILNFFLMGLSVQKAVTKDEKDVKGYIKATGMFRLLGLFLITIVGVLLPCFNLWAVIVPLFFPRVAIMLRPFVDKKYTAEIVAATASQNVATNGASDSNEFTDASDSAPAVEDEVEKGDDA